MPQHFHVGKSCVTCLWMHQGALGPECRKNAPRLALVERREGPVKLTLWPDVDLKVDGCGEHKLDNTKIKAPAP